MGHDESIDKAMTNIYRDIAILYDLARSGEEANEFDKKILEFINLEHFETIKRCSE